MNDRFRNWATILGPTISIILAIRANMSLGALVFPLLCLLALGVLVILRWKFLTWTIGSEPHKGPMKKYLTRLYFSTISCLFVAPLLAVGGYVIARDAPKWIDEITTDSIKKGYYVQMMSDSLHVDDVKTVEKIQKGNSILYSTKNRIYFVGLRDLLEPPFADYENTPLNWGYAFLFIVAVILIAMKFAELIVDSTPAPPAVPQRN
jgi:hypothetical protein